MLTIYNAQKRILIVKDKKGKITQAYGGAIATHLWHEHLRKFANNSIN